MGFVGRLAASGRRQKTVRGLSGRRYDERMPQRFVTPVEERKRPSSRTARYHLRQSSMLVLFPPVFDQRSESNLLKTSQNSQLFLKQFTSESQNSTRFNFC